YPLPCASSRCDSFLTLRPLSTCSLLFFYTPPPPTQLYTLSLHDALPISRSFSLLLGSRTCLSEPKGESVVSDASKRKSYGSSLSPCVASALTRRRSPPIGASR